MFLRLFGESPVIGPLLVVLVMTAFMTIITTMLLETNYPWRNRKARRIRTVLTYLFGFVLAVLATGLFLGTCLGLIHLDHTAAKALRAD